MKVELRGLKLSDYIISGDQGQYVKEQFWWESVQPNFRDEAGRSSSSSVATCKIYIAVFSIWSAHAPSANCV